jgi:hypothetical protein
LVRKTRFHKFKTSFFQVLGREILFHNTTFMNFELSVEIFLVLLHFISVVDSLLHSSGTFFSNPWNQRFCHTSIVRAMSAVSNSGPTRTSWPTYLVEFRSLAPNFRINEFRDAAMCIAEDIFSHPSSINFHAVIPDTLSVYPLCATVQLPNDDIAVRIVQRCATVRRLIQIWGDGASVEESCSDALVNFFDRVPKVLHPPHDGLGSSEVDIAPFSKNQMRKHSKINSWRVSFQRCGRGGNSGLDNAGKKELLHQYHDILIQLNGKVDLMHAEHDLIYIEDCHTFLDTHNRAAALGATQRHCGSADVNRLASAPAPAAATALHYVSSRCIFGRILATGPSIVERFRLRDRPFIGTTSMNALCAHLTANAARVVQVGRAAAPEGAPEGPAASGLRSCGGSDSSAAGSRESGRDAVVKESQVPEASTSACVTPSGAEVVLDPFCGTGSLLIAAANLGR